MLFRALLLAGLTARAYTPAGSIWSGSMTRMHRGAELVADVPSGVGVWRWLLESGSLTRAQVADLVFEWSTPADPVPAWRVCDPDAVAALLGSGFYVERANGLVYVGHTAASESDLLGALGTLHGLGLDARPVVRDGRTRGILVHDPLAGRKLLVGADGYLRAWTSAVGA